MYSSCGPAAVFAGSALEGVIDAYRFDAIVRRLGGPVGRRALLGALAVALAPRTTRAHAPRLACGPCEREWCAPGGECICESVVASCYPEACSGCCVKTACGSTCVHGRANAACGTGGETCRDCGAKGACQRNGVCSRKKSKRNKRKRARRR